jgi:hypothetical protein
MIGMVAAAKRFWKETDVTGTDNGWMIMLDGRAVKTPAGRPVALSSQKLAEAVGAEWKAQEENIIPATMPHFRYVVTAIDRVTPQRGDIINQLVGFSGNDLICYRDPGSIGTGQRAKHGVESVAGMGGKPAWYQTAYRGWGYAGQTGRRNAINSRKLAV